MFNRDWAKRHYYCPTCLNSGRPGIDESFGRKYCDRCGTRIRTLSDDELPDPRTFKYGTSCLSCSKPMGPEDSECSFCYAINTRSRQAEMIRRRTEEVRIEAV